MSLKLQSLLNSKVIIRLNLSYHTIKTHKSKFNRRLKLAWKNRLKCGGDLSLCAYNAEVICFYVLKIQRKIRV